MHAADSGRNRNIALSGILAGLTLVLLYFKSISPVMDLTLYFIISIIPAIVLIETKAGTAWLFFTATSLLSLLFPVNKLALLYYYTFFGYYGIVKYIVEKRFGLMKGLVLKLLVFIPSLLVNYYLAAEFIPANAVNIFGLPLLIVIASIVFFVYDYIYSLVVRYYENVISKRLRR